jgi:hypothetical protein
MRRFQQEKVLESNKILHEANVEIVQLLLQNKQSLAVNVAADCQELAASIGTYIESIEGNGTKIVGLLEEYCLDLYNFSIGLMNGRKNKDFLNILCKKVSQIERCICHELKPTKLEVAFFPYKACNKSFSFNFGAASSIRLSKLSFSPSPSSLVDQ